MPHVPYWKWLGPTAGHWELKAVSTGLVQLFRLATGQEAGAFAFEMAPDLSAKMRQMILGTEGGPAGLQAKLIVDGKVSADAQAALRGAGVPLQKLVECAAPFEIRYEPATKKVFVSQNEVKAAPAPSTAARKIKVLIVDDSPTIRKVLEKILSSDPEMEVVGGVGLPSQAEEAIARLRPDVITLDIHMPEMNGVDLLKRYLPKYPIPTVMISSISVEEGPLVLSALEAGAVDYLQKPSSQEINLVSPLILLKVKTAARASLQRTSSVNTPRTRVSGSTVDTDRILAIGASTGGTEALKEVFLRLPEKIPAIVVVQHIPAVFSKAFADRLHSLCPFEVFEGEDGMEVKPGRAIIAPGGKQMKIRRRGSQLFAIVDDSPPVNRHRPSVDVLFNSVAEVCGDNAVGAILTGMGSDGANGLLAMKSKGCFTLGQDEKTCVVYGMPQAAHKIGATHEMVPLHDIAARLMQAIGRKKKAG